MNERWRPWHLALLVLVVLALATLLQGCTYVTLVNTAVGDGCYASRAGAARTSGNGNGDAGGVVLGLDVATALASDVGCPPREDDE